MELLSGMRMNRVDHQMGVKVLSVHMRGHQNFTAGEELLRQFQPNLMGLSRCKGFFRGEGLGVLVEEGAGVFPIEVFGGHKALHGHICHTVDARQVAVAILIHGFRWLGHILDYPPHTPCRLLAFLDKATGRHGGPPGLSLPAC